MYACPKCDRIAACIQATIKCEGCGARFCPACHEDHLKWHSRST